MNYIIEILPLSDYYIVAVKDKESYELKEVFTLNESGADILKLILTGNDMISIANQIADIYSLTFEQAQKDIILFIEKLEQKGIQI